MCLHSAVVCMPYDEFAGFSPSPGQPLCSLHRLVNKLVLSETQESYNMITQT